MTKKILSCRSIVCMRIFAHAEVSLTYSEPSSSYDIPEDLCVSLESVFAVVAVGGGAVAGDAGGDLDDDRFGDHGNSAAGADPAAGCHCCQNLLASDAVVVAAMLCDALHAE